MSFHAHHLRFDERWAPAQPRSLASLVRSVIHLAGVGAVNDDAWNSIANGTFRQVFHAELHVARSGISPQIVLDDQHQAELLYCCEVQALIRDAGRLPTVADVGEPDNILALQACAEADACHDANQLTEHRDRSAHVAASPVSEVRRRIPAESRRVGLGHVLPRPTRRLSAGMRRRTSETGLAATCALRSRCSVS